jgi:hypothetical protein
MNIDGGLPPVVRPGRDREVAWLRHSRAARRGGPTAMGQI